MNRERGGGPSWSVGWCVPPCLRSGRTTAPTGAKAVPDAPQEAFHGLFRSISPARRQVPGSRTRYKLHR
jgi:hypothetical protein